MTGNSSEFSHPVDLAHLDNKPIRAQLQPNDEERVAIAKRLGLVALDKFHAQLELQPPTRGGPALLLGDIRAELSQACVISLKPVPANHHIPLEIELVDAAAFDALHTDEEEEVIDSAARDIEPVTDGVVDLGELAIQYLSLALDPYPRAEGAEIAEQSVDESAENLSPFAALKQLQDNSEHGG